MHIISTIQSNHPFIFPNINIDEQKVTLKKENNHIIKPILYTFDSSRFYAPSIVLAETKTFDLPEKLNYIIFPMYGNKHFELMKLKEKGYRVYEEHTIQHKGYEMELIKLKKNLF